MSFTDQQIMQQIQYTTLETPDLGATWPSGMWTKAEVVQYLTQRQNQFLRDTHAHVGIAETTVTIGVEQYDLPEDWIATVSVTWLPLAGGSKPLPDSDTWEADHGLPTWTNTNGTPKMFFDTTPRQLHIVPRPNVDGKVRVFYIPSGVELDGTGELMTVQDEFLPSVKYGALAEMFGKVGRGQDKRAVYCQSRYELGVEIARMLLKGWAK